MFTMTMLCEKYILLPKKKKVLSESFYTTKVVALEM